MLTIASAAFVMTIAWGEANANTDAEPAPAMASSRISTTHLQRYSDLAVTWMQQYFRIDTTNPPGNELRAATFLKKILDDEGIGNQIFEYAPGRADLWARLPHTHSGSEASDHSAKPYGCGHQRRFALEDSSLQRGHQGWISLGPRRSGHER
jgi:hypothetical protein